MFSSLCPAYCMIRDGLIESRTLIKLQQPYVDYLKTKLEPLLNKTMNNPELLNLYRYLSRAVTHNVEFILNLMRKIMINVWD
mmetsp:Transcript_9662/g.8506  ORF Transcript_9662/g.8506 Transcript_9662/m.8506 type:complete len:82 (-) Transcript_9662:508-753(-)